MSKFSSISLALALLVLFLAAAWIGGHGNSIDVRIVEALAMVREAYPWITPIAAAITQLGSAGATLTASALACLWLCLKRAPRSALLLGVAVAFGRIVDDVLKVLIARVRPPIDLHAVSVSSASFPSGHAANSMAAYLLIALIAFPGRVRLPAVVCAILLSVVIGLTRPILGVHWPSDVIGGWVLALAMVWSSMVIGRRFKLIPLEPQHQIVRRHRLPLDQD